MLSLRTSARKCPFELGFHYAKDMMKLSSSILIPTNCFRRTDLVQHGEQNQSPLNIPNSMEIMETISMVSFVHWHNLDLGPYHIQQARDLLLSILPRAMTKMRMTSVD